MKEDEYNFKTHIITRFNHTTYSSILMHREVYTKKDANDGISWLEFKNCRKSKTFY